ncbi:RNase H domain-containing protein [Trichonephila clavipes]|nr:RNase H domain-containing protein [Trichonephila clavipes]
MFLVPGKCSLYRKIHNIEVPNMEGSVLSPILFSLYLAGIEKVAAKSCEVGLYADDIAIWNSNSERVQFLKVKSHTIDEGLNYILSSLDPKSIWILSDSRSAIQNLSNWSSVGDKTGTSILNKLKQASSSCDVHFQWILSHVDIWGKEEADALAKEGAREALATSKYSARKNIDKKTWLVPLFILGIELISLTNPLL